MRAHFDRTCSSHRAIHHLNAPITRASWYGSHVQPIPAVGLSDNCSKEVGMTKTQALIKLARARWVTVQVSLRCIGLASLSQRVTELEREHGMKFDRRWITGNGSRCLAYRLRSDRPDICA